MTETETKRRPPRPKGDPFIGDNYDVMIAITEGIFPWLAAIDIKFIGFLCRTTKGWETRGGDLSLDWVAQRIGASKSGLEKSLQRLKRRGLIGVQHTPLRARYTLRPWFVTVCREWLAWRRGARQNRYHKVLEILDGQGHKATLDDVIAVYMTVTIDWDDYDLLAKLVVDTELRTHHRLWSDDPIKQADVEDRARMYRACAAPRWKPWPKQGEQPE